MKKIITLIMICTITLVTVIGLTGCTSSNNDPAAEKAAVCYVLGNTACSLGLNLSSPLVQDTVYHTVRHYGYISVVNADGVPDVVFASSFDIPDKYKNASRDKLDTDARSKTTNLITSMQGVIATDPEVDYLEALRLAVRSMASLEGYDSKTIVVIGTGLSTTGVLNFQNNLISAESATVVELLKEKTEIPDFSGMTVYWQQMGDVAAPQASLTAAQRNKLQQIYSGIVETGGGKFVYNEMIALPVDEGVTYPAITPVELPADTPISFEDVETIGKENVLPEPIVFPEKTITFIADKAEYLYPEEAVDVLKPVADYLAGNQINVILVGSTAGDENNDFTLKLSKDRAEAVKRSLVELGVDAERIITVGLGCADPWHIQGVGYEGAAASSNRKVVLIDAASETAKEILAGLDS